MKIFLNLWVYIFPWPIIFFVFGQLNKNYGYNVALFALVLPVSYGYIFPGIAVNVMKKWQFRGRFLIGNYYFHHGFKYASNILLAYYIATVIVGSGVIHSVREAMNISILTGLFEVALIWVHDTLSIKTGKLVIKNVLKEGTTSALVISSRYVPICFFAIGFSYSVSVLLFLNFTESKVILINFVIWVIVSLLVMGFLSSLLFGIIEKYYKKKYKIN